MIATICSFFIPPLTQNSLTTTSSSLLFNDLDILEHIPFYFTNIASIVSFRAINKTCRPASLNHLEYHIIECTLHHDDLWRSLIERPALAKGVRQVTIMPEITACRTGRVKGQTVPPLINLQEKPEIDYTRDLVENAQRVLDECHVSEQLLIRALQLMSNLERFESDTYPQVVVRIKNNDGDSILDLWGALKTLTSLKNFSAVDLTCDPYVPSLRLANSPSMITSGVSPISDSS